MVKVLLNGCSGQMGKVITNLCAEDADIQIVAGVDIASDAGFDYPVYSDIEDCSEKADVIIDFSHVSCIDALLEYSAKKQIPVVLCTTGLSDEQLEKVKETSEKTAVLKSANMSLGINTVMKLVQDAAKVFAPAGFDMEIVEKHHNRKLDAPSGTAIALADSINSALDDKYDYKYDRSSERKKREKHEIGIQAVRAGTIVGEHEIIFAGTDEVITIKHTAYSRAIFGKGAIEAAKFLAGKGPGFYDMSDVISSK